MHSAGFVTKRRRSPIGLGGAVAVHAVVAAIYILTPKELYQKIPVPILLGTPIEAERDPDPLPPPEPEQDQLRQENISVPQPEVKGLPTGSSLVRGGYQSARTGCSSRVGMEMMAGLWSSISPSKIGNCRCRCKS